MSLRRLWALWRHGVTYEVTVTLGDAPQHLILVETAAGVALYANGAPIFAHGVPVMPGDWPRPPVGPVALYGRALTGRLVDPLHRAWREGSTFYLADDMPAYRILGEEETSS